MPYVASIGTYLPCWGAPRHRVAGDDEDAITLAVEAGRAALIANNTAALLLSSSGISRLTRTTRSTAPLAVSAVTILEGSASGTG